MRSPTKTNSPCQHLRKCRQNRKENMHTDLRVERVIESLLFIFVLFVFQVVLGPHENFNVLSLSGEWTFYSFSFTSKTYATTKHIVFLCITQNNFPSWVILSTCWLKLPAGKPKKPNALKTICLMLGTDFITDIIEVGS